MPDENTISPTAKAPVRMIPSDYTASGPVAGLGLCLSGGGYRAMLFHLGSLIRLNQAGLLARLNRVSSVSGGSITAAVLGLKWTSLNFDKGVANNLQAEVIDPVRQMADKTIDAEAIVGGLLFGTVSDHIQKAYDDVLYHGATLQDLPPDGKGPRFVINATNLQTGALFRFSQPFMADYLVGMVKVPAVPLAKAVAASSAFPPLLSPCILQVDPSSFVTDASCPLQHEPFTSEIILADGGVYDNMGIETVWKEYLTVLVSDAGGKMQPQEEPKHDWLHQGLRVEDITDNQVRSLRKRQIIEAYKDPADGHKGTYWGIRSHVKDYKLADPIDCSETRTLELADTPTRLKQLDPGYQERLVNWGYAICDTAIRAHVDIALAKGTLPYPGSGI